MTKVNVELGYKVNMGPGTFETFEIKIGLIEEKGPDEKVSETFNRVYSFVEERLSAKVREAKEELVQ